MRRKLTAILCFALAYLITAAHAQSPWSVEVSTTTPASNAFFSIYTTTSPQAIVRLHGPDGATITNGIVLTLPVPNPPPGPMQLFVSSISATQVSLGWTWPTNVYQFAQVWRSDQSNYIARVPYPQTNYTDTTVSPSTTYAYGLIGESLPDFSATNKTQGATSP